MKARGMRLTVLLAALAMLVAACGGGSSSSEGRGKDGTFTYAMAIGPTTMDPHKLGQWNNSQYLTPVYDTLVHINNAGQPEPRLATDWEYSEDGLTFSMNLRDDVTFTDGEKFDADAVKVNLDRLLTMEDSPLKGFVGNIEEVTVESPTRVNIKTKVPDAQLPSLMGDREGMMISPKAIESGDDLSLSAVGAGPYKLVEFTPNVGATYERNDDYWGEAPAAKTFELKFMPDATARLNALKTGTVDMASVSPATIQQAKDADLGMVQTATLQYTHILMNLGQEPLDDPKVRRAIAVSLDRDALCDVAYLGACEPASSGYPPENQFASPNVGRDYFAHNVEEAKKLIAESTHPDGVEFDLLIAAGVDPYPAMAELMQQQLAEAGITMTIRPIDINQMTELFVVQQDGNSLMGGGGQVDDPGQYLQQFFAPTALYNPTNASPDGLADVIESVRTTVDPEERIEYVHEALDIIAETTFNVPMLQPLVTFAYNTDVVKDFEPSTVGSNFSFEGVVFQD